MVRCQLIRSRLCSLYTDGIFIEYRAEDCVQGVAPLFCADSTMSSLQSRHNQRHENGNYRGNCFGATDNNPIHHGMAANNTVTKHSILDKKQLKCQRSVIVLGGRDHLCLKPPQSTHNLVLLESQHIFIRAWFA